MLCCLTLSLVTVFISLCIQKKIQEPITAVTANGEVQTDQEAQVYVHDLSLFVTVQLLEDTPAVLLLGKLCEEHGYTNEWTNGQKPHLTKNGKRIRCKTENFVPVVVPVPDQDIVAEGFIKFIESSKFTT